MTDIVVENGDQIAQALQPILDKLAITGGQFWDIYVEYIKLDAILSLVGLGIAIVIACLAARTGYRLEGCQEDKPIIAVGCFAIMGCMSYLVLLLAEGYLMKIMCPEYFAIQNIVSQLGSLV